MRVLRLITNWVALCALGLGGTAARSDLAAQHADALARINVAAEQRTLAQTMAKSTCFLMADIAPQTQAERAFIASMMIDDNIGTLRSGDVEGNAAIVDELAALDELWATFAPASRQVMSGDFHAIPVEQLISLDPQITATLEALVTRVMEVYRPRLVTRQEMVSTVTLAAGQSMLVRKAVKEFCYIGIDLTPVVMRTRLEASIERFETILMAMELGDFDLGIVDPPSLAAIKQVADIKTLWQEMRPLLQRGLGGDALTRADLAEAERLSDEMVALTDAMAALYLE